METTTDVVVYGRVHHRYQSRSTGRNPCKEGIAADSAGSALKKAKLAIRPPVQQELAGRCVKALRRLVGLCTSFSDEATSLHGSRPRCVLYTHKAQRIAKVPDNGAVSMGRRNTCSKSSWMSVQG